MYDRRQQWVVIVLGLAVFLVCLLRPHHRLVSKSGYSEDKPSNEPARTCFVEVKGAVHSPGLYAFAKPPTPLQTIQKAGGLIQDSPFSFESSPQTVHTGSRVDVKYSQLCISPMSPNKCLVLGIPIDINKAAVEDLVVIPRMNRKLAKRIVEFRDAHSPFETVEDLTRVKGIGPKTAKHFSSYLKLGGST